MLIVFALVLGLGHGGRAPNACQVLSARDVAAVQGARFKSAKLKESGTRELQVSQCFYAMPRLSDSVSVDLIRGDTRAFWKRHLQLVSNVHHDRAPETIAVDGVGDAAVWSGTRLAGALYVLKGETIVRVSLGGDAPREQKIERAKKLAARALRRL